jgi:hypothetical protein
MGLPPTLKIIYPFHLRLGIKKWNYDAIRKFQDKWVAKFPWAELFVGEHGNLHIVKCKIFY